MLKGVLQSAPARPPDMTVHCRPAHWPVLPRNIAPVPALLSGMAETHSCLAGEIENSIFGSPIARPFMPSPLNVIREQCARRLLALYQKANAGHIASSLSCLEILVDLCFGRMTAEDVVILSKGHAAGALYTTLALSGRMPEAGLETFYEEGTLLAAHPPCSGGIKAIPFGTGSLGHGLSLAAGTAFSQRYTGKSFHTYAILSDGDCNEGSTWEAALFAAHHQLSRLTVILDLNGLQGIGRTRDILNLEPVADKWRAFGFTVAVAENGHDFASLAAAHAALAAASGPRCLLARTVKGHGISYMQDKMEWHYLPMDAGQYEQACREIPTGPFPR